MARKRNKEKEDNSSQSETEKSHKSKKSKKQKAPSSPTDAKERKRSEKIFICTSQLGSANAHLHCPKHGSIKGACHRRDWTEKQWRAFVSK